MSKNNQIDLVEFPTSSPDELKAVSQFFTSVFGWRFKQWDETYFDAHDSGIATGVNASTTKEQAAPLTVIYADDLETTKDKVWSKQAGK